MRVRGFALFAHRTLVSRLLNLLCHPQYVASISAPGSCFSCWHYPARRKRQRDRGKCLWDRFKDKNLEATSGHTHCTRQSPLTDSEVAEQSVSLTCHSPAETQGWIAGKVQLLKWIRDEWTLGENEQYLPRFHQTTSVYWVCVSLSGSWDEQRRI